ncbi:MAG: response regulator [Nitratireductor sp.]
MGRVLIVDDNPANRKLLEAFCDAFGLETEVAETGEQALDRVAAHVMARAPADGAEEAAAPAPDAAPFGIIFMDIHMPGLDGVETSRRLLAGPAAQTPIVAVTADVTAENRRRCLEAGIVEVVHKPISARTLAPILCRYFDF